MSYSHLLTASALHSEITARAAKINGKAYLFFDEIQEVKDWKNVLIPSGFRLIVISISQAPMPVFFPENWQHISADAMWNLHFIHFHFPNFWLSVSSHSRR